MRREMKRNRRARKDEIKAQAIAEKRRKGKKGENG